MRSASRYSDARNANDDTPMLRTIAERRPINISPASPARTRPATSCAPSYSTPCTAASSSSTGTADGNPASSPSWSPSIRSARVAGRSDEPALAPLLAVANGGGGRRGGCNHRRHEDERRFSPSRHSLRSTPSPTVSGCGRVSPSLLRQLGGVVVICAIYGTTGELIKLAPVLVRIRETGGRAT